MKKLQNKKGFTLVEMIVVLAIIAILIALLAPNVARLIKNAQITSDNAKAKTVMNTAQAYATDAIADGQSLITGGLTAHATDGYSVELTAPVTTGDDLFKKAFYSGTAPSYKDATGDAYLPENTLKNNDAVTIYLSVEGAVMGCVYHNAGKIKAVAGVAPAAANGSSVEFTTANLRGKTIAAGAF